MALPKAFDERIRIQLGDEYEDYIKCFDSDMYHGIRVNTSKISVEDFLKISPFELEPVPWTKNGFYNDLRNYIRLDIERILCIHDLSADI